MLPFEKAPHNPDAGVGTLKHTLQPQISHPVQSNHQPQVPTYAKKRKKTPTNPKIYIRGFFLRLQSHATIAAGLSTGNTALSRTTRGFNPPSGHSFPNPHDVPDLTLLSIFYHYLGQVLLLLLLAQPADQSYLRETVPLNTRKCQRRPLVESLCERAGTSSKTDRKIIDLVLQAPSDIFTTEIESFYS